MGFRLLVVGLAVAVLLAGCGGGSGSDAAETTAAEALEPSAKEIAATEAKAAEKCPESSRPGGDLSVALDGWETPETAGILMAGKRGYFADAGLEVTTLAPPGPTAVIPDVVTGADDLGISHEPEVVLAREAGEPIVIVGSLISQPTAAMIWLRKSKIGSIADLKGKTIAIPGLPSQESFLKSVLAQGGLTPDDVKVESVGNKIVPDLASGRVDAIFARSSLQGAELEARGLKPVITRVQDLGVPAYDETVLIAQADCAAKKHKVFRKFMSALARGTAAAIESPGAAVDALEADGESNPETGRKAMSAQAAATFPLLSRNAHVDPGQADGLVNWMYEEEMTLRKLPAEALLTNAYLAPPQSP